MSLTSDEKVECHSRALTLQPSAKVAQMVAQSSDKRLRVFISFAANDDELKAFHPQAALLLANSINEYKQFDCTIFSFHETSGPNWTKWMKDHLESSDYIIFLPSKAYAERSKRRDTGVAYEFQHIEERVRTNERSVICVVFPTMQHVEVNIPMGWRSVHRFRIDDTPETLETLLYRMLGVEKTPKVLGDKSLSTANYVPITFGTVRQGSEATIPSSTSSRVGNDVEYTTMFNPSFSTALENCSPSFYQRIKVMIGADHAADAHMAEQATVNKVDHAPLLCAFAATKKILSYQPPNHSGSENLRKLLVELKEDLELQLKSCRQVFTACNVWAQRSGAQVTLDEDSVINSIKQLQMYFIRCGGSLARSDDSECVFKLIDCFMQLLLPCFVLRYSELKQTYLAAEAL